MAKHPEEVSNAVELFDILTALRTKTTIDWKDYGKQLTAITDRLFARPECRSYFEQFDDSFAHLSPDIVHEVIQTIGQSDQLLQLIGVNGTLWGRKACGHFKFLLLNESSIKNLEVDEWAMFKEELLPNRAKKSCGKLKMHNLCKWFGSGAEVYPKFRPQLTDIDISYHIYKEEPVALEELKPLRAFLVNQLKSPYLKNLKLEINGDLQLEEELLAFCTSGRCESLNWDCQPLSVDFFVQVYNAFKKKRSIAIEPSKEVAGFIKRVTLTELVQAMQLKGSSSHYSLTDRCVFNEEQQVQVKVERTGSTRFDVCIALNRLYKRYEKDVEDVEEDEKDEERDEEEDDEYWKNANTDAGASVNWSTKNGPKKIAKSGNAMVVTGAMITSVA